MKNLKIIWINNILFFVGWTAIMLAGADFPPPVGFISIVILIVILDFIQYKYLQNFLPKLLKRKKNLFIKNLIFFTIGGVVVSLFCLASRYKITLELSMYNIIIWITVLTVVSAIYGICFWFFNLLLIRIFKCHEDY